MSIEDAVVREDEGVAVVCVSVLTSENDPCPITFPFLVNFITSDGSASKYKTMFHYSLSQPPFLSSLPKKISRVCS